MTTEEIVSIDTEHSNDANSDHKKELIRKRLENSSRMIGERRKERLTNTDSVVVKTNEFWSNFNELEKTILFAERKMALRTIKELENLLNTYYELIADYDKRQATEKIKELTARVAPAERKKFSFGARKKAKSKLKTETKQDSQESSTIEEQNTTAVLFENKNNENLTYGDEKQNSNIEDHMIRDCTGCTISVNSITGSCFLRNLKNCHIRMGPILSSCFIRDCADCTFDLPAKQIRIHKSKQCTFQLYVTSDPIIEHSSELTFAAYGYEYANKKQDFENTPFLSLPNKFDQVRDFNWLKMEHSPNWSLTSTLKTTYSTDVQPGRPKHNEENQSEDSDDDEL